MKKIVFREDGEKVRLCDLLPGTLFEHDGCIALKSEYQTSRGLIEAAIVDSGEQFWGGAKTVQEQRELLVQPFELTEDEEASAVEAVAVVRCKDCKRSDYSVCGVDGVLYCMKHSRFMVDDDFCSYGEREDEHET